MIVLKLFSDITQFHQVLITNYKEIIQILESIFSQDSTENRDTKREVRMLLKKKLNT